jgi:outer membrane immunogenic protein
MSHRFSAAVIGGIACVAFAVTQIASAADLPRKAPAAPPPPPVYTWTGCYIGANIGGAWSRQTGDFAAVPAVVQVPGTIDQNDSSVIGGVHLGCNYQFDPRFVVGVEGDWSWTGLNGSGSAPNILAPAGPVLATGGINMSSDTKWIASLRGRLGWVVMPQTMIYVTGGAAWAKTNYTGFNAATTGNGFTAVSFGNTNSGWVVGGGAEYMLTPNWFVRAEYLYYQFSGSSAIGLTVPGSGGPAGPFAAFNWNDLKVNEVRAGISYKFF